MARLELVHVEARIQLGKPFARSAELIAAYALLSGAREVADPSLVVGFVIDATVDGDGVAVALSPPHLLSGGDEEPLVDEVQARLEIDLLARRRGRRGRGLAQDEIEHVLLLLRRLVEAMFRGHRFSDRLDVSAVHAP